MPNPPGKKPPAKKPPAKPAPETTGKWPLATLLIAFPAGAVVAVLTGLVAGAGPNQTRQEEPVLVIIYAVCVIASLACAAAVNLASPTYRLLWKCLALGLMTVGFIAYVVAAALAANAPTVHDIQPHRRPTGTTIVTVSAEGLEGRQKLVIRATWGTGNYANSPGHDSKGNAKDSFPVPAQSSATRLRVIAFVTRIHGAGPVPTKYDCGDYDACSAFDKTIAAPRPRLSVHLQGRTLKVSIGRDRAAPDSAYLLVSRRGHELFKDAPNVRRKAYAYSTGLAPRRRRGPDKVCVTATYVQAKLRTLCANDPAVVRNRFDAPR